MQDEIRTNPHHFFLHFSVTFSHFCSVLQLQTKLQGITPDSKEIKKNLSIMQEIWYSAGLEKARFIFARSFIVYVFTSQPLSLDLAHIELCAY